MCVTFLALAGDDHPFGGKYRLILINNRDECWDEHAPERGTWLGMDRRGRVGVLLSITEPPQALKKEAPSRGQMVREFLAGTTLASQFLTQLCPTARQLNGFQFLALDRTPDGSYEFGSLTNRAPDSTCEPVLWPNIGIYGFGNSPRDSPFHKVDEGERAFRHFLAHFDYSANSDESELVQGLLQIVSDRTPHFPDEQIRRQTGCPEESDAYKFLCSLFVDGTRDGRAYGTRSSSVILVDAAGTAAFHERQMVDPARPMDDQAKWAFRVERFTLKNEATENDK